MTMQSSRQEADGRKRKGDAGTSIGRAVQGLLPAALGLLPAAFLALFYFYPLAEILRVSLARAEGGGARLLADFLRASYPWKTLGFTAYQAALSTLLTLMVGLPGAYLIARFHFPGKGWLRALTAVPFVLPTLVVAAAFDALLGPRGWLNLGLMSLLGLDRPPIAFQYTLGAILLAHVFYNTTIVLRMVGDFWSNLDPKLPAAARALGATPFQALREITLPLLAPSILASALLVFIFDFTSFGVILVLGGPRFATLEVEIYRQTVGRFNLPVAALLAMLQLACTLALTLLYSRLSARVSQPVSLRPQAITQRRLSSLRQKLLAAAIVGTLILLLVSPLAALTTRSFFRLEAERGQRGPVRTGLTLDFYRELSINRRNSLFFAPPLEAVRNSVIYAGGTVLLSLALALPTAWLLARSGPAGWGRWLDPLIMLPLGTSAVTLGLGFIVALDQPPLNLRASPGLIPLAHTLVAFPFVVRSITPAMRAIRPRLRQAAAVLGASPAQVWRSVDLPIIGRAVLVGAAFAFAISLGEFGATALIARPELPTLPIAIFRFLSQPGAMNYGQAMALSTVLMAVSAAAILLIERVRVADVGEF